MGREEIEDQPDSESALYAQIINDTVLLISEKMDRTIIEAYEEKHNNSEPFPPLHSNNSVYFHIGKSSHETGSFPTVTLLYKPSDDDTYIGLSFVITEGASLTIGKYRLNPKEINCITDIAVNRPRVSIIDLERAVNNQVP